MSESLAAAEPKQVQQTGFLDDLARGTPTPGGGSAAAFAGAAAAALAAMVARLTVGKKKYIDVEPQMWQIIERADRLRQELTAAIDEDAAAFQAYMAAVKLPKDTPDQQAARALALEQATLEAIGVPMKVAHKAVDALEMAVILAQLGNVNAISDAASSAALARASLTGAGLNVRINCLNLVDQTPVAGFLAEVTELECQAAEKEAELKTSLVERGHLAL